MRTSSAEAKHAAPAANCLGCPILERCLQARCGDERERRDGKFTSRIRLLIRGDVLVRDGGPFRSLYIVRSGSLKCCASARAGHSAVTEFLLPGDVVGLGAIAGRKHHCDVRALEDSVVCAVPFARLESRSLKRPAEQTQLCRLMGLELNRLRRHHTLLASRTSLERTAAFLSDLDERVHVEPSDSPLRLSMQRQDIASYLGINAATASRCLGELRRLGLLEVRGRGVRILDRQALRELAEGAPPLH
jgi:CRP/FNR family transcriptional regulator, anaerobic regulatory protein